jgi:hypothetical protein
VKCGARARYKQRAGHSRGGANPRGTLPPICCGESRAASLTVWAGPTSPFLSRAIQTTLEARYGFKTTGWAAPSRSQPWLQALARCRSSLTEMDTQRLPRKCD